MRVLKIDMEIETCNECVYCRLTSPSHPALDVFFCSYEKSFSSETSQPLIARISTTAVPHMPTPSWCPLPNKRRI